MELREVLLQLGKLEPSALLNANFGRFSRPLLEGVNALIIPPPDNVRGGGHYD